MDVDTMARQGRSILVIPSSRVRGADGRPGARLHAGDLHPAWLRHLGVGLLLPVRALGLLRNPVLFARLLLPNVNGGLRRQIGWDIG